MPWPKDVAAALVSLGWISEAIMLHKASKKEIRISVEKDAPGSHSRYADTGLKEG